ncbi:hypothetical protein POTOM_043931 [Populus tomentosa]|uniref:Integrase catalytic domain-containing protein n=1 Tax=Populus tomentosa TaxID=118781 RepID=A0A8X7YMF5_POPTO|nr:hypothetical protein POTOM_043931 [Populus tomentosa]
MASPSNSEVSNLLPNSSIIKSELTVLKEKIACPRTHEQNGVAERKIRRMVDTGLALLADGKFHFSTGTLVFSTSAYFINRMLPFSKF